jgi:hypothetical protein
MVLMFLVATICWTLATFKGKKLKRDLWNLAVDFGHSTLN